MKRLPIALLMLGVTLGCAAAATPEEDYLAARDAYIKKFTHGAQDDAAIKAHERALADLQTKLRRVIGTIDIKGFPHEGKFSLDGLIEGDEGFGMLDGLVFGADGDKQQVLVTTASLFDKWLAAHRNFWKENPLPTDMAAALERDDFYTQALGGGAAFLAYAKIPITKPAWATLAYAILDGRTQDQPPQVPDEMIITVRRADRVFIVTTNTATAAGPIAACDAAHARAAKQAEAASEADQKAQGKNPALHEKAEQLARDADRIYPDCFAKEAPRAGFFPALVRQAQALVDALPGK
jgi:hypothetical protein